MRCERDELEAVDVDEPAVRDLQLRDHRERQERECEERRRARPAERRARRRCSARLARSPPPAARPRGARRPAAGSSREHAARRRPRRCRRRAPPAADRERHVVSSMPTTTMLCASCATRRRERAAAQPRAAHEPEPDPTGAEMPLDDGDLREVALGIGDRGSVDHGRLARRATSVTTWSATSPIARARPSLPGNPEILGPTGSIRTVCRTQSGTRPRNLLDRPPRFRTSSGTNSSRSGRTRRSAW